MNTKLIPTTVVGSYPQPEWLIDRDALRGRFPPRVKANELWRIPEELLDQAQDDATILTIRDMENAGIDIISDGEIRRESYSNSFANALDGIDTNNPGQALHRSGKPDIVPRVVGPIRRLKPIQVKQVEFLRQNTDRQIKATIPGPFTMSLQAQNDHYKNEESLAMAYAEAVNVEVKALFAAGADVVQLDEPYMQGFPDKAKRNAIKTINYALENVHGTTALHMCFGYAALVKNKPSGYSFLPELENATAQQISIEAAQPNLDLSILKHLTTKTIILGVLNLDDMRVEKPESIAERIRDALQFVSPDRLIAAPDCGMKYLPRQVAFDKLSAMVKGVDIVRQELA